MFRIKAKRLHPDVGGSGDEMKELNEAWERIKAERGSGS
jgi:curved DNA-binding protein CbpA